MIGWLYLLIPFKLMDIATAFLPFVCLPFAIITWVLLNNASVSTYYPLAPRFYKLMYALPGRNYHEPLVAITSGEAADQLCRNLLVLFAWALLPQALAVPTNIHRYGVTKEFERGERKNRVTNKRMRAKRSNRRVFRVLKIKIAKPGSQ